MRHRRERCRCECGSGFRIGPKVRRRCYWQPRRRSGRQSDRRRGRALLCFLSQLVGPVEQLLGRHDHLRLQIKGHRPVVLNLFRHHVLAHKVERRNLIPGRRDWLVYRERFVARLLQPNLACAVVREVDRAGGRADLLIVHEDHGPRRIRPHRQPPPHAARRHDECDQRQRDHEVSQRAIAHVLAIGPAHGRAQSGTAGFPSRGAIA